jgi:isopentenyl diphosphate isomerase/L-lactate dehydrogenase-like FMN-dependent dehydrogenase
MHDNHRRQLVKFLLGSPLFTLGIPGCSPFSESRQSTPVDPFEGLIKSPTDANNIFDFQKVAEAKLPPAHYGYMATGVLDDRTLVENEAAFNRIKLRMRRLVGAFDSDLSVSVLGEDWSSPIIICPCGSQKAFHPEGETATAKAAQTEGHQMMLSTVTTTSVEEVNAAKGSPVWYQLYPTESWEDTMTMVKRAEAAGCETLVLTVDMDNADKRETLSRMMKLDERDCTPCHGKDGAERNSRKPMVKDLKVKRFHPGMSWDFVQQLKEATSMKLILKGIVTSEDAKLSVANGIDAVIVSNHGGRATESGRATIDCLPEVVKAVDGQIPVILDSGIRRGGDIFKALAMGAAGVGIGRPYLWGLGAFGQEGVAMVLKILKSELAMVMQQTGVKNISGINMEQLEV